jgi:hypothetical protein
MNSDQYQAEKAALRDARKALAQLRLAIRKQRTLDALKRLQPPLPPRIRVRNRKGRCYELAARGILETGDGKNWTLVHGTITASDGIVGHAWLEQAGWAYDPVLDRLSQVSTYRMMRGAKTKRRYSAPEAAGMMVQHKSFGPWTKYPSSVVFRGRNGHLLRLPRRA